MIFGVVGEGTCRPSVTACDRNGTYKYNYSDNGIDIRQESRKTDLLKGERLPVTIGDLVCFIDGIIFNQEELKRGLEKKGCKFESDGKFEVVVHLYNAYGEGFAGMLKGRYTVVLWDQKSAKLMVCCDQEGLNTVYYCRHGDNIVFSSTIHDILKLPGMVPRVNWQEVYNHMSDATIYFRDTLFSGIRKLNSGEALLAASGKYSIRNYSYSQPAHHSGDFMIEHEQALRDSVSDCLGEDRKTGLMLSGGVDSAAILCLAKQLGRDIPCYSIGFDEDSEEDDLFHSRSIAEKCDVPYHCKVLDSSFICDLDRYMEIDPFTTIIHSIVPTCETLKLGRKESVLLNGAGSESAYGFNLNDKLMLAVPVASAFARPAILASESLMGIEWKNKIAGNRLLAVLKSKDNFSIKVNLLRGFGESEKREIFRSRGLVSTEDYLRRAYKAYPADFDERTFYRNRIYLKNRTCSLHTMQAVSYPFLSQNYRAVLAGRSIFDKNFLDPKAPLKKFVASNISKAAAYRRKENFLLPFSFCAEQKDFLYSKIDQLKRRKEFSHKGIEMAIRRRDAPYYWRKVSMLASLESFFEVYIDRSANVSLSNE